MVIDLGLSGNWQEELETVLVNNHRIEITLQLMNLSHVYLADVSHMLIGGQVDIDAAATESTRSATLELLDPHKRLKLDSEAPEDGSIYYTRMFRIIYSVISVGGDKRFDIPIFCGPISKVERNGIVLSVSCLGKEKLSMSSVWRTRTYGTKAKKSYVMKNIMTELGGEKASKVIIPEGMKGTLPRKLKIDSEKSAWPVAQSIARSIPNGFMFYDGRGNCYFRRKTNRIAYVFRQKGALLSEPTVSFDAENVINAVNLIGGRVGPKGDKRTIRHRAVAPKKHPLSPWSMGRFGNPRYLPMVIQDDKIKSNKEARRVSRQALKRKLEEQIDVAFDSLPMPHLEEYDMCKVESDQYTGKFRLMKMSIPLTANGRASIGYLRKATPQKRLIKIKPRTRTPRDRVTV